jgi:hypothetical protein
VFLIRYADDAVLCFQYREDAEKVLNVLAQRFAKYGVTLHPEKTRLVAFGREALASADRAGTKPDTFAFLGFTHKCARSRRGKFTVHIKTDEEALKAVVEKSSRLVPNPSPLPRGLATSANERTSCARGNAFEKTKELRVWMG